MKCVCRLQNLRNRKRLAGVRRNETAVCSSETLPLSAIANFVRFTLHCTRPTMSLTSHKEQILMAAQLVIQQQRWRRRIARHRKDCLAHGLCLAGKQRMQLQQNPPTKHRGIINNSHIHPNETDRRATGKKDKIGEPTGSLWLWLNISFAIMSWIIVYKFLLALTIFFTLLLLSFFLYPLCVYDRKRSYSFFLHLFVLCARRWWYCWKVPLASWSQLFYACVPAE